MSVTKAIIPSSINGIAVVKIGDLAFSPNEDEDETSLLETVAVPNGVTELGAGAFSKCENMREVSLPSTLEFMDIGAFYDCEGVWDIYYAGTEKQFQDIQHRGRNSLWNAEYHFTDGMREGNCSALGSNVKWELDDAGTLKISGSGFIRDYCTYGMTDLPPWIAYKTEISHVVICDGVHGVGTFAFHECYYIQDVAIPKSVEYVSTAAFEECDSLSKVFYEGTEHQWDKIEFDPRNDEIHSANLVYEQATQVSSDTIQTGKCGKSIRWSLHTNGILSIYGSGDMDSYGPYWSEETAPWYSYKNDIQTIVIDAGITSIGANAFSNLSKVTSISIPATVTWIRYGAFSDCTNLKTIYIPENVSTIQSQAFLGCTHLEKIEVDAKNRYYYSIDGVLFVRFLEEENDFYAGNWLWLYPSAKADADYCIPNDVVAIDGAAFMYCGNLETITIPLSVNDISWDAFWKCPNLTTITILNPDVHVGTFFDYEPDADHAVEYSVFFYCDNITDVFFSGSESQWYAATIGFWDYEWGLGKWATTGLPDDARIHFDYNPNLLASGYCGKNEGTLSWTLNKDGTLDIHGNGPMVDFNSFVDTPWTQYADVIKRLVVGDGVTSLGDNAFTGCNNISEITIPGSVTYIGAYSFSSCTSLKSVNLPYGVAIIGEHAFSFSGVTYIYLPLSLVRIDYAAFGFCENLAKADYEGTKKQWRTVAIADENSKLIGLLPNTESREMGIGTLEYVFEPVIVINEQTYLIPSAYYESMSELLANKKVSDKRVVYEVVDDEIESIYSIYDVINVGIDFQKANEIVFKDGSYNQENVDVTICASIISPSGSSIYDSSQLRSLGSSLSVSFSTLELKSLSELMNFGKGGFLGLQTLTDKAYDLNSVTISGYGVSTLIGTYSVHVESTMEPTNISTEAKIRAGLSCSGNEKSYYNVTSILFGNLDLQEQQAQENKRSRLEQEKYEKLKSVLENINTSITLDPVLLNFFSMKQVEDMEKIVAVYVSEVIAAQEIDTGTLFQQLTSKVRKRIREKVMDSKRRL